MDFQKICARTGILVATLSLLAGTVSYATQISSIEGISAGAEGVIEGYVNTGEVGQNLNSDIAPATGESDSNTLNGTAQSADSTTEEDAEKLVGTGVETVLTDKETATEESTEEITYALNLYGYNNLGIAHVDNNLNIRETASEDGKLVGKLPKDAACEILDTQEEWAHISSGKVEGYVLSEYLYTGEEASTEAEQVISTVATVTTNTLKVREQPSMDCEVITLVPNGEELDVVEEEGDWVKILLDDEEDFVSAEYVKIERKLKTAITMTELLYGQGVSDVRVSLCQYAKQYLGNPYVWGGISLTNGADCSGFVLSVFNNYGVSLPHSSRAQSNCGTKISASEAQPGDLFFYSKGGSINHVAIYIGGGQVIHASSPKTGIRISSAFYRTPAKVVRILNNN